MPLINCQVELKHKRASYCVLSAGGVDNVNGNANDNIILFLLSKTQNYVPVVTLLARDNQKLSNLSKGFERSVYWNKYKTKSENKATANEYSKYVLE